MTVEISGALNVVMLLLGPIMVYLGLVFAFPKCFTCDKRFWVFNYYRNANGYCSKNCVDEYLILVTPLTKRELNF